MVKETALAFSVGKLLTTSGVHTGPGAMQLQRTPVFLEASSMAMPLVNVTIAPCNISITHLNQLTCE